MSTAPNTSPASAPEGAPPPRDPEREAAELSPRARTIGVVVWCSFLAAAVGTMLLFAFLDPGAVQHGALPSWWTDRHTVYALGFFFFWLIGACSAALTIYMAHTDRSGSNGGKR
ncbi:MAG: hypothetical protein WDO56_08980 [Gammaproteobacteria bacterium]